MFTTLLLYVKGIIHKTRGISKEILVEQQVYIVTTPFEARHCKVIFLPLAQQVHPPPPTYIFPTA